VTDSFRITSIPAVKLANQASDNATDLGCLIQRLRPQYWFAKSQIDPNHQLRF
jgi:hypothetical protein